MMKENVREVSLTGRNVKLIKKTQSLSTVNAGATVQLIFNSNPKTIAKIKYLGVYIAPPSGATTGTQRVYITLGTDTTYTAERIKDLGSVAFNQACLLASTDNGYPIRDLEFDSIVPLVITYVNSTDVIQNSASYIELVYEEEATV